MQNMRSLRCPGCNRLLCEYKCSSNLELGIKCSRCKKVIYYIQSIMVIEETEIEEKK